ncbi:MAG: FAD-dependent oxidoreductase, partial [Spirochaetaceae bacterium]|nr:FAD-dependent oxidoreductase [Spirochaetaceae bacterium]
MQNAPRYGLAHVDVPPVDFREVRERIRSVITTIQQHDSAERFCGLGAQVEFGDARFVDEHSISLNGKTLSARYWVIATGSSPSSAPIPGLDETEYMTNREIFYMDRLPRAMIVIGGGPIGIEMAQAFNRLGTDVHVIQRGGEILNKEDKDMADEVMRRMAMEGVRFHLKASTRNVRDLGEEKEVVVESNGEEKTLRAQALLVALGREANLSGLGLEDIGVEFDARGLKLDERLRTTAHR